MPEPVKRTIDYAFTITLKPPMYRFPLREQVEVTKDKLLHILSACPASTLVVEVTKHLNVHYHGIVAFELDPTYCCTEQYCAMFKDCFRKSKEFGYIVVKPVTNFAKWSAYILKDRRRTFMLTRIHPLLRDGHELENMFERAELRINNYWPVMNGERTEPDIEYAQIETVQEIEDRITNILRVQTTDLYTDIDE